MLGAQLGEFFVRDQHAAHHHDAGGNGGEIVFQARKLPAAVDGLDEERLEVFAHTFGFREREDPLGRLRSFVLLLVFVSHRFVSIQFFYARSPSKVSARAPRFASGNSP